MDQHRATTQRCRQLSETTGREGVFELAGIFGASAWDPWDLVQTDRTRWMITDVSQIERRCALSDGEYRVTIAPRPGNRNINGNCGAWVTAAVKIERAGAETSNVQFERSCNPPDHPIIIRVVVHPGGKPPAIVELSSDEFYQRPPDPAQLLPASSRD